MGSKIVEKLALQGLNVVAISRRGHCPVFLEKQRANLPWLENVSWTAGDVSKPDEEQLKTASAVITTVGSPPLPTFSPEAFDHAVFMNGRANASLISALEPNGVKKFTLVSAHIPWILKSEKFGYYVGKRLALEAAEDFSKSSKDSSVTVLQPSGIYGVRHLDNGFGLPLHWYIRIFL